MHFLPSQKAATLPDAWVLNLHEAEEPIRAELFSVERLEQHAESLARAERPGTGRGVELAPRVRDNRRVLLRAYGTLNRAAREQRALSPAAEWLLDNLHVVEEQVGDILAHLPRAFYRQLPKIDAGHLRGYPRVYGLAWAFVAHTDSRFSGDLLTRFVGAYQRIAPLQIGELWAVPIMLRIALLENLRRLSTALVRSQLGRQLADQIADGISESAAASDRTHAVLDPGPEPIRQALVTQLVRRLKVHHLGYLAATEAIDARLAEDGTSVNELVEREQARQTAAGVTVRNIITSMRAISAFDWPTFVEQVSLVDAALREYPGYRRMDLASRDRYRDAVEELAHDSHHSELHVARAAVARAASAGAAQSAMADDERVADPGYYLIGGGRPGFERELGYPPTLDKRLKRAYAARPTLSYPASALAVAALLLAIPLASSAGAGLPPTALLLLAVLAWFPASDIAVHLLNRLLSAWFKPRHLLRLELEAVPQALRTLVVTPTMLANEAEITEQIKQLEVQYLANREGAVQYALLSDWRDADSESVAGDEALRETASSGIAALNARYGEGEPRFFLFHRRRLWNPSEGKWMGWERKRGKLHELNRLLRGATDTSFLDTVGVLPAGVRYVITLDADTRLPLGTVRNLVGIAAHPLNRPRLDAAGQRVVEGYAILQPRVTPTLPRRQEQSLFRRIFSSASGLDPYAGAISNVYQDLFGEGSYTGKGLYDVDAFEAALAGRIPENTLLSHDLFEGTYARCALASDVEVYEDVPSHAEVAAVRAHRWTRGDWQLLPWILGYRGRDLSAIGRWKMLDNLRRSLVAPASLGLLLAAWASVGAPAGVWLAFVLVALGTPALLGIVEGLLPRQRGISPIHHLRAWAEDVLVGAGQTLLALTLLAHQAWLMLDAIVRTLARLYVSRRRLLEWVTAAQSKAQSSLALTGFIWPLRGATIVVVGASAVVLHFNPGAFPTAAPVIGLWWLAPLIARWVSRPRVLADLPLGPDEIAALRLVARRIWRFFATFVTAEDHHLPPDNFQEDPRPVLAHRSSPTNFGLSLLATVSARDFGWLGLTDMTQRLEATLASLERLERFRGHLYNWYDTRDLRPLEPRYVSTVDSGNYVAYLLVLKQACLEMLERPLFGADSLRGIGDSLSALDTALRAEGAPPPGAASIATELHAAIDELHGQLDAVPATLSAWRQSWSELGPQAANVLDLARALAAERGARDSETVNWAMQVNADVASHRRDSLMLCAWTEAAARCTDLDPEWRERLQPLDNAASLMDLMREAAQVQRNDKTAAGAENVAAERVLRVRIDEAAGAAARLIDKLHGISAKAQRLFDETDFAFLFNRERKLFAIGYSVGEGALDGSYYDLLASEARLASFVAIAKGDVAPSHWLRLGRRLTPSPIGPLLLSWSGSMFEYLMPSLVLYTPRHSLLAQTCRRAVQRQIDYGKRRAVPWGVSESAFYVRDRDLTYQYAAFGVPGLGLKRGLAEDLVVAPYATALAAMYAPRAALANFERLDTLGALQRYGYYEALDFTPSRLPQEQRMAPVRAYMAHHQGMSLVALANVVFDGIMRHRLHREPLIEAAALLLEERTPRLAPAYHPPTEPLRLERDVEPAPPAARRYDLATLAMPQAHWLSNGRYAVMLTAAGSGYSLWDRLAVTRWRDDGALEAWGSYLYLRDTTSGRVWSATYQPTALRPDSYEALFLEDRARFTRVDASIESVLEVVVSAEDSAETRRLTLINHGPREREIEVTSYAEVVLAPPQADAAHPAFSKLFVETEFVPSMRALLAKRRPRSSDEAEIWAAHVLALSPSGGGLEWETDRARFLGRNRGVRAPVALEGRPLSGTIGPVLDPIFSLRTRVRLAPGATAHLLFTTLAAGSRAAALELIDKYQDGAVFERVSSMAWTHAQVLLHYLRSDGEEAMLFQQLASRAQFPDHRLQPSATLMQANALPVTHLWRFGISGDRPIVLLRIDTHDDAGIARQLARVYEYWRARQAAIDLVILNERPPSYGQDLQVELESLARAVRTRPGQDGRAAEGTISVVRGDLLEPQEKTLLQAAARVVLVAGQGSLAEQIMRPLRGATAALAPRARALHLLPESAPALPPLELFNGSGGFAEGGRDYAIVLAGDRTTPAPWINVLANPGFGALLSETGAGYTWCVNSRENQLTPWSNDPVSDACGEALYLRDEDSGALWSACAWPIRLPGVTYLTRHGHGYSRFESNAFGIASELVHFIAGDDPVKICHLRLLNHSSRPRRLSLTAYVEWALKAAGAPTPPYVLTERDPTTGALLARNPWSSEFGARIAFADLGGLQSDWTCDRVEFLGRYADMKRPAALQRGGRLGRRGGPGVERCAALQAKLVVEAGGSVEVVFLLGQAASRDDARALIGRYRDAAPAGLLGAVRAQWEPPLTRFEVSTPKRALDLLVNRWLPYQTLACRFWGRAAFYQAGGAYGFRDQLQDAMAVTLYAPDLARAQLLHAASHQFVEGDVQHWWHPPSGRGVRTRISDDRIWLAYVAAYYIAVTGDAAVLDEDVPLLDGPALAAEQEDAYFEPQTAALRAPLYEHCARAIEASLATGIHGLPLIGSGDWNDGMNRVGHEGKGESVWLAWFLHATLMQFAPFATARGEPARAQRWRAHAAALKTAVEADGWDGAWYRRAFFDDGSPLGSVVNAECRIDSIAQSWAVISGAAEAARARRAMDAVEEYLVRPADETVVLFTPAFNASAQDPGYIKGYVPGVRENGGQYNHAAVWCVIAYAMLGDGDRAWQLLRMVNPIERSANRAGVHAYKVEPYAVAADIYTEAPHARRGGWTWYTGAAGWLYRAALEHVLGVQVRADRIRLDPCIPHEWQGYSVRYRATQCAYDIAVDNPQGVCHGVVGVTLDGVAQPDASVPLLRDGRLHRVEVQLGEPAAAADVTRVV